MKIKINVDFDDSGDEDACFQGWTLEADTRPAATKEEVEVALEEICNMLYRMTGYGDRI